MSLFTAAISTRALNFALLLFGVCVRNVGSVTVRRYNLRRSHSAVDVGFGMDDGVDASNSFQDQGGDEFDSMRGQKSAAELLRDAVVEDAVQGDQPDFPKGSHVVVFGMQTATDLNGQEVTVEGVDKDSGRYVVRIPGGDGGAKSLRKVTASHLKPLGDDSVSASDAAASPEEKHREAMHGFMEDMQRRTDDAARQDNLAGDSGGPQRIPPGTKVRVDGLVKLQSLNGQMGTIRTFDYSSGRYIVQFPGMPPRKLKAENLLFNTGNTGRRTSKQSASDPKASICQQKLDDPHADKKVYGPLQITIGTKVILQSLTSAAAIQGGWNGMTAVMHCFDETSGRYVVSMQGGAPKKLKSQNLRRADAASSNSTVCQQQLASAEEGGMKSVGPLHLTIGSKVILQNLTSTAAVKGHWNGMEGVVHCFDTGSGRYVVAMSDGSPRKLKAQNVRIAANQTDAPVEAADVAANESAVPASATVVKAGKHKISVCNAYPAAVPMQVFAVMAGNKHKFVRVVTDLNFQDCVDAAEFPFMNGSLSFVVGRFQVGQASINQAQIKPDENLELTVYRGSVNSLKAAVHQNFVSTTDKDAYYLHIINAYAGSKLLELHVQRGKFAQQLPLNSTFRLAREQKMQFTLTDGFQRLHLGFQPQKGRTFCVVLTGADAGLRGEPRNVGIIAHELGAWTSSEEMATDQDDTSQLALSGVAAKTSEKSHSAQVKHKDEQQAPRPGIMGWLWIQLTSSTSQSQGTGRIFAD